jgi:hypothetical protein
LFSSIFLSDVYHRRQISLNKYFFDSAAKEDCHLLGHNIMQFGRQESAVYFILKIEATGSSETLVPIY